MREMDPDYTDDEVREIIQVLDLTNSGNVGFDEFKKVFVGDIRTSESM
jgi:Ca2+-binding EF-hand superfamily protein